MYNTPMKKKQKRGKGLLVARRKQAKRLGETTTEFPRIKCGDLSPSAEQRGQPWCADNGDYYTCTTAI